MSNLNDMINDVFPSDLREKKEGYFNSEDGNMTGGILGVAVAVGLELVSPTGSKTSAVVAAIAGGAALYAAREVINSAPQAPVLAAGVGCTSLYIGMMAGRIAADYFPGNIE